MAAAVKAQHGHPGGMRAGHPGDAVLDHEAPLWRDIHLRGGEEKEIGRGLAACDLACGKDVRSKQIVETGAGQAVVDLLRRAARRDAFEQSIAPIAAATWVIGCKSLA